MSETEKSESGVQSLAYQFYLKAKEHEKEGQYIECVLKLKQAFDQPYKSLRLEEDIVITAAALLGSVQRYPEEYEDPEILKKKLIDFLVSLPSPQKR